MKNNPFSLDFGAEPDLMIPRFPEQSRIIDSFTSDSPSSHIFFLVGARGSGKTVLMTSVSHIIREQEGWLHVDLNPEGDMLNELAARITKKTKSKYPHLKLGISVKGVAVSAESEEKYSDIQADLDVILEKLQKKNLRVLITIDEIHNSRDVRMFTGYFQHCLREKLPVFVLMTGLFKNLRALQNNRSQTFLKRAPRIDLGPLSHIRIARKYEEVFALKPGQASEMADLTGGYSYGFQILGYLVYDSGKNRVDEKILDEYKLNLFENSYEKIWEELSAAERTVVSAIARSEPVSDVKLIRQSISMDSNTFSTYKDSLYKYGLLSSRAAYGKVEFSLPFFGEYVTGILF